MCDTCVELDKKIERYRRLSSQISDQITIDRIKALIQELQTQKVELHPEQKGRLTAYRWYHHGRTIETRIIANAISIQF
jgi:hypothetical protein